MELDGYCPELQLAFEYQGEQHYSANSCFNQRRVGFAERLHRDRLKAHQCEAEFDMIGNSCMGSQGSDHRILGMHPLGLTGSAFSFVAHAC